jgi:hypothetical protein
MQTVTPVTLVTGQTAENFIPRAIAFERAHWIAKKIFCRPLSQSPSSQGRRQEKSSRLQFPGKILPVIEKGLADSETLEISLSLHLYSTPLQRAIDIVRSVENTKHPWPCPELLTNKGSPFRRTTHNVHHLHHVHRLVIKCCLHSA